MKKVIVKNEKFKVFLGVIFTISFVVGVFLIDAENNRLDYTETEVVTVHSGDTLWGITGKISGDSFNISRVQYEIEQLNKGKDVVNLKPGDELVVPVLKK